MGNEIDTSKPVAETRQMFGRRVIKTSITGVNLYTKKDAVSGTIILGTKEAVTLFNKKGIEIEQERDADTRENSIWSRKYYLAAITDKTKAVKITVTPAP